MVSGAASSMSPFAWSLAGRLSGALAVSGVLWLAVAWALGWLG